MKKVVRNLSMVLAVVFLVSFTIAGCGAKNEETSASSTTEAAKEASSTSAPEAPEKVTLTLYGPATGLSLTDGVQPDPVSKEIERATGVTIDLDAHPDDTKFNAMLASGDLPDILIITGTSGQSAPAIAKTMIEGDMLLPMDDLIKSHGQNLSKLQNVLDFSKKYYSNGTDKQYVVQGFVDPTPTKGFDSGIGPALRWDLYKEMGYPEINNGDDWLKVVADMLAKNPKTADGQNRYGFSIFFEWGWYAPFQGAGDIVKGLEGKSVVTGRGGFMEFDILKETVRSEILNDDSALWTGVEFFYKANKMKLLDPDSFTNKWANVIEKATADRILSNTNNWAHWDYNIANRPNGKGVEIIPMKTKAFIEGTASPLGLAMRLWCIPKNCSNPTAAMRLMDYFFSEEGARTLHSGVMGTHYVEKDGQLKIPEAMSKTQQTDTNWYINSGVGKYSNFAGLGQNYVDSKYKQKLGMWWDPSYLEVQPELNAFEKAYTEHYGIANINDKYAYLEKASFDGTITSIMAVAPEEIKAIDLKISDYLGVELPKLLIAKSDEEFAAGKKKIIEECKSKGIEKSHEFWMKAWNDAIKEAQQFR